MHTLLNSACHYRAIVEAALCSSELNSSAVIRADFFVESYIALGSECIALAVMVYVL
jgi:hypothetical protein